MTAYNSGQCNERHETIDRRFEKGEEKMKSHDKIINNHEMRLALAEDYQRRNNDIKIKILDRGLQVVAGVVTALILAWLLKGG